MCRRPAQWSHNPRPPGKLARLVKLGDSLKNSAAGREIRKKWEIHRKNIGSVGKITRNEGLPQLRFFLYSLFQSLPQNAPGPPFWGRRCWFNSETWKTTAKITYLSHCVRCGFRLRNQNAWWMKMMNCCNQLRDMCIYIYTSSTAQGGGGSFKNRKPIGDVGCCESGMAEQSH